VSASNDLLEHAIELFPAPVGALHRVTERQRVRRRNQRIAAGAVAAAIALVALTWGSALTRSVPTPADPGPTIPSYHRNGEIAIADWSGLIAIDPATGASRRLIEWCPGTQDARCHAGISWSPDGSRIAYAVSAYYGSAFPIDHPEGVWIQDVVSGRARRIAACEPDACPSQIAWSPDGRRLAIADGTRLATMNPDGEVRTTLWTLEGDPQADPLILPAGRDDFVRALAWSPDAKRIVFVTATADGDALHVIDRDGQRPRVIARSTDAAPYLGGPAWSPDGSTIAYLAIGPCETCQDLNTLGFTAHDPLVRIVAIDPDGTNRRTLIANRRLGGPSWGGCACHAWWPPGLTWSPDGTRLAIAGPGGLFVVHADGTGFRRLGPSGGGAVTWRPVP
jgi:dipeptidyl aminopeptidase/acylaminoacyl peptidase